GILGASIALELARLGRRVVVLDKNGDAGDGSTRSSTAILRSFYGTRPAVALALEGRKVYEAWPEHLAVEHPRARFERVGCALLLPAHDTVGDSIANLVRSVGVEIET